MLSRSIRVALVALTISFGACKSSDAKKEPYAPPNDEKPLPLGVYISKLDNLLLQWNDAMLKPETPNIRARRSGLELEITKRVKQRFTELKRELDTSPVVRNREILAAAIGFLKEPEALNPLMNALNDPTPEVRGKALLGLSRLVDKNTPVDVIATHLRPDCSDVENVNAALALYKFSLGGLDMTKALPDMRNGLISPNPAVRVQCAAALGEIRDRQSIPQFITMLHDERQLAAAAAANALGKIADLKTSGVLIEALTARDFAVRDEARGALKRMNDGADLGSEPGPWLRWREKLDLGGNPESRPIPESYPSSRPSPKVTSGPGTEGAASSPPSPSTVDSAARRDFERR